MWPVWFQQVSLVLFQASFQVLLPVLFPVYSAVRLLHCSGLGCYDFDNCFDGDVLKPAVREFIAGITYPIVYVERSVSGNGLHVFVEAEKQRGYRRDGVEFYSWGRFIRMTLDSFKL